MNEILSYNVKVKLAKNVKVKLSKYFIVTKHPDLCEPLVKVIFDQAFLVVYYIFLCISNGKFHDSLIIKSKGDKI